MTKLNDLMNEYGVSAVRERALELENEKLKAWACGASVRIKILERQRENLVKELRHMEIEFSERCGIEEMR